MRPGPGPPTVQMRPGQGPPIQKVNATPTHPEPPTAEALALQKTLDDLFMAGFNDRSHIENLRYPSIAKTSECALNLAIDFERGSFHHFLNMARTVHTIGQYILNDGPTEEMRQWEFIECHGKKNSSPLYSFSGYNTSQLDINISGRGEARKLMRMCLSNLHDFENWSIRKPGIKDSQSGVFLHRTIVDDININHGREQREKEFRDFLLPGEYDHTLKINDTTEFPSRLASEPEFNGINREAHQVQQAYDARVKEAAREAR